MNPIQLFYIYSFVVAKSIIACCEKIGYSKDIERRDSEHRGQCGEFADHEYLWVITCVGTEVEGKKFDSLMKKKLESRRTFAGSAREFYKYIIEPSSISIILKLLDLNNIRYKITQTHNIPFRKEYPKNYPKIEIPVQSKNKHIRDFKLYPFQDECLVLMENNRRYTFVIAGGAGKSLIVIMYAYRHPEKRILILVPTDALRKQFKQLLCDSEIENCIVQTYQSSDKVYGDFDCVMHDECHRTVLNYKNNVSRFQEWVKKDSIPQYFFTATSKCMGETKFTMNNKNLYGPVYKFSFSEAVDANYVTDFAFRAFENTFENIHSRVVISVYCHSKIIIFCQTTKECDELSKFLTSKRVESCVYHSRKSDSKDIEAFKNNSRAILICCDMVSEGFDCPDIDCVVLYGTSNSSIQIWQRILRGARKSVNKDLFYVYFATRSDNVANIVKIIYDEHPNMKKNVIASINGGSDRFHGGLVDIDYGKFDSGYIKREICKNLCENPLTAIKKLARGFNKDGPCLINREEIVRKYDDLFDKDIKEKTKEEIREVKNILTWSLPKGIYERLTDSYLLDKKKIKNSCKKLGLKNPEDYIKVYGKIFEKFPDEKTCPPYSIILELFERVREELFKDDEEGFD